MQAIALSNAVIYERPLSDILFLSTIQRYVLVSVF